MMLERVARRVAPGLAALGAGRLEEFRAIVDEALMERPAGVRRQLALFLSVIRWLPVLRWGKPFEKLDGPRQDAMLRFFHDGPVDAFRKGFWGLKALIFMGYYGREEAWAEVGYEPDLKGNSRLDQNP